jgi:hypothetical protein
MSSNNRNRGWTGRVVLAGAGLMAAVFPPIAVANADQYVYGPDTATFVPDPGTEWGIQGLLSGETATGDFSTTDTSTHTFVLDSLSGQDAETSLLQLTTDHVMFTNDHFTVASDISDPSGLAPGSVIDDSVLSMDSSFLPPVEGGYSYIENVFVDAAAGSTTPGIVDTLITPAGDFVLF